MTETVYETRCAHGLLCARHTDQAGAESWVAGAAASKHGRADCAPYSVEAVEREVTL